MEDPANRLFSHMPWSNNSAYLWSATPPGMVSGDDDDLEFDSDFDDEDDDDDDFLDDDLDEDEDEDEDEEVEEEET